jgi:hypothetical protein
MVLILEPIELNVSLVFFIVFFIVLDVSEICLSLIFQIKDLGFGGFDILDVLFDLRLKLRGKFVNLKQVFF